MAKIRKNRLLTRKELINLLSRLNVPLPEKQDPNSLFTALLADDPIPPFPPPPSAKKK